MEKDLSFKPMTEGLGFHPFSDGLPYAPLSKSSTRVAGADADAASARARALLGTGAAGPVPPLRPGAMSLQQQGEIGAGLHSPSNGLGATAAGRPRFANRLAVDIAPLPTTMKRPQLPTAPGRTMTVARPEQELEESIEYQAQTEFGFFYLIKRLIAYGLDSALNISVCIAALGAAGSRLGVGPDTLSNPSMAFLTIAFLLTFNWAMIAGEEVIFKTTIGKRVFGLYLHGSAAALFLRAFFFLPSVGFTGLGVLWAVFDGRRRCWHDHVVDLQPEET